ncbi:16S rRNA (uracil(1498)-N(3))-methyltransferase [Staphylococcus condimenti]|uniref:Ribosomal RNA small subunit methyltransferase E n=1 Tax=Staphylococcus condimenti TaxID=70255 RepID=A0A143PA30_9STAP|nr:MULTISPECIES: 16S rRNA (uracil(1498)-N(3))-methyltransferase [Staphylococcus]AMY04659.1 16S rRNA (uracil(1498)-N(3))-methyltransferase [Staphylococcus condimenti]APR60898.1 16S rRNA (uracil(1498)-N(3))-methyltransferase [Staphylococcus condimenti]MDK8644651.1 16S rRNA (uracil(1498)-N(3))-methyltransferase [Staphylococcus condimenti]OFO99041.1 16S rRNA (uracil(1498)-N(3))-methyltransferase [Staphylococcus sp. HMSC065E08]PNZ60833.1 16S rRNA (uracil(1498)-N(3))-methyltransferase [Staphylococcu
MQRYFINQNADKNQRFFITEKEDIHHINNVMRNQSGDFIIVTFNHGEVYKSKIISIHNEKIEIELSEELNSDTELPVEITICSGLLKADKYEWLLQKCTELGASHFIPVQMDRSIVKLNQNKIEKKLVRWNKIVKEAAEQSYRLIIPTIEFISNLKQVYVNIDKYDYVLVAYEDAAKEGEISHFKKTLQQFKSGDRVLIVFGPEGGLSEEEVELFQENSEIVGLGKRILRAETAPLYALSAISYEKELMG